MKLKRKKKKQTISGARVVCPICIHQRVNYSVKYRNMLQAWFWPSATGRIFAG